jgi:hypothetical protein
LITLVDSNRQFFLSACGLPEPFRATRQTPLDYSLCQFAEFQDRLAAFRPGWDDIGDRSGSSG